MHLFGRPGSEWMMSLVCGMRHVATDERGAVFPDAVVLQPYLFFVGLVIAFVVGGAIGAHVALIPAAYAVLVVAAGVVGHYVSKRYMRRSLFALLFGAEPFTPVVNAQSSDASPEGSGMAGGAMCGRDGCDE